MRIKTFGAAVVALGAVAATTGTAEARDGCGLGFHRNFYGYCRPNGFYRPFVVRPVYYGYGWRRPYWRHYGWHRPYWRRYGWHRSWGWHRHVGWHGGWHHRW